MRQRSRLGVTVLVSLAGMTGISVAHAAPPAGAAARYHFSALNIRRAGHVCRTVQVTSINDRGVIGGAVYCGQARGFLRSGDGKTELFAAPGKGGTTLVNTVADNGIAAVSRQWNHPLRYASFERSPSGTFTAIADPNAGKGGTLVSGINSSGTAVGAYYPGSNAAGSGGIAFVVDGGHYRDFRLHLAGARKVFLTGINEQGVIAGGFSDRRDVLHGFVDRKGKVTVISVKGAGRSKGDGTVVDTVANNGATVGLVLSGQDGATQHGFVRRDGETTIMDDPRGVGDSVPQGVNRSGTVVGSYFAPSARGFVARIRK